MRLLILFTVWYSSRKYSGLWNEFLYVCVFFYMFMPLLILIMHVSAQRCCISPICYCLLPSGGAVLEKKTPENVPSNLFVHNIPDETSNSESKSMFRCYVCGLIWFVRQWPYLMFTSGTCICLCESCVRICQGVYMWGDVTVQVCVCLHFSACVCV